MKSTCLYCGNNQVFHPEQYISSIVTALVTTTLPPIPVPMQNRIFRFFIVGMTPIAAVSRYFGWHKWSDDIDKACSGRSRLIWQEAQQRNITMQQLCMFDKPFESYRAFIRGHWEYFGSLPIPPELESPHHQWLDDKVHLKTFLASEGVPVSRGGIAQTAQQVLSQFHTLQKPVIIKPRFGSRGRHTTTHIYTEEQCLEAYRVAKMLGPQVVIEEHLTGSVYRGTCVDGVLQGILRGDPPRVVGDGVSTISELIAQKNNTRPERVAAVHIDEKMTHFLARQSLGLDSVLAKNVEIDVNEKIGLSYGGYAVEMFPETHPKIEEALTRAAQLLAAPVVGFDFIIKDVTADPDLQRWGIIEANGCPFIDLHFNPPEGPSINVASAIWDLWR